MPNNTDLYQILHSASYLGLHCLLRFVCSKTSGKCRLNKGFLVTNMFRNYCMIGIRYQWSLSRCQVLGVFTVFSGQSILIWIVLGFNNSSTLVGHFVLSPRESLRDRRDNTGDEREGKGRNRINKNISPLPLPATRIAGFAQMEANISWTPQ